LTHPALLALALLTSPATAQEGPQPALEDGETIESELHADLNSDSMPDLAYIAIRDDFRELRVVTSYVDEFETGENPVQRLALDTYPLADATLTIAGKKTNVLVLEELTGGTTAVLSTYRFRWEEGLGVMRLIGLDATLYSRTFAHDGKEASWNLVTGDLITRTLKLNKGRENRAYDKVGETRSKRPSPVLVIEESPDGASLLGWPDGQ